MNRATLPVLAVLAGFLAMTAVGYGQDKLRSYGRDGTYQGYVIQIQPGEWAIYDQNAVRTGTVRNDPDPEYQMSPTTRGPVYPSKGNGNAPDAFGDCPDPFNCRLDDSDESL